MTIELLNLFFNGKSVSTLTESKTAPIPTLQINFSVLYFYEMNPPN